MVNQMLTDLILSHHKFVQAQPNSFYGILRNNHISHLDGGEDAHKFGWPKTLVFFLLYVKPCKVHSDIELIIILTYKINEIHIQYNLNSQSPMY